MNIIPLPNHYQKMNGFFILDKSSTFNCTSDFALVAKYFEDFVFSHLQIKLENSKFANISFFLDFSLDDESYNLTITEKSIELSARTERGAFYGLQTLLQSFSYTNNLLQTNCIEIKDTPRFSYRGFMLDVSRHFFEKEVIFKLIDIISKLKFNFLHLHLSDDQGFRLESEKFPLLHQIGSIRSGTYLKNKQSDNVIHQGYYTKQDLKAICKYANEHFLDLIPEIDIPGHANAIIAAYPHLSCEQKSIPVRESFGISDVILCAGNDEVYKMIEELLLEIIDVMNPRYIHLGGDEAPKTKWKRCPLCQQKIKENNLKGENELQAYFFNHFNNFLREKNIKVIGWNECINNSLASNVIIQHWKPFTNKKTVIEINQNRKTIISNFFSLYLDYPYTMTPLKKTYEFNPILKGVTNPEAIIGIEAPLWTEWVKTPDKIDFQVFPRLFAISEIGWTKKENKNYDHFIERLKANYPLLHSFNIKYAQRKEKPLRLLRRIYQTIKWIKNENYEFDENMR